MSMLRPVGWHPVETSRSASSPGQFQQVSAQYPSLFLFKQCPVCERLPKGEAPKIENNKYDAAIADIVTILHK